VPGLPNALPNPGQVIQHDPSKRAKFSEEVKQPMSDPIDLPKLANSGPRAPSEFLPPDSMQAKGNAPIHYPSQARDRMGGGKYAHMAPPNQYNNANSKQPNPKAGAKRNAASSDWN
jgi:hypothetical protein